MLSLESQIHTSKWLTLRISSFIYLLQYILSMYNTGGTKVAIQLVFSCHCKCFLPGFMGPLVSKWCCDLYVSVSMKQKHCVSNFHRFEQLWNSMCSVCSLKNAVLLLCPPVTWQENVWNHKSARSFMKGTARHWNIYAQKFLIVLSN